MDKTWKYWLKSTAAYYNISQKEVLKSYVQSRAKSTFYWLIFRSGLDLVKTSIAIGKSKTTIVMYITDNAKKENDRYRDKSAEDFLLNQAK